MTLSPGFGCQNSTCLVTGSSGMCGARLVEMLFERGAFHVICFDILAPNESLLDRFQTASLQHNNNGKITILSGNDGDLTSDSAVDQAFQAAAANIDVVYHIGALVGPFFDRAKYHNVNHYGTIRMLNACRKYKVKKFIYSSSPSTRFTGVPIRGWTEDQLPMPTQWLAMYAEAKAYGEMQVSQANSIDLYTISVAPHQVYGPHDQLMLPNLLETAGNGRLRIFGSGDNQISVTYVDNYCHGLLCASDALTSHTVPCAGQFYIVTDGNTPVYFWKWINQAVVAMGFEDLYTKRHLPKWLLYLLAYLANGLGYLLNKKFKLNPFNVKMLTMDRYFCIDRAKQDLKYEPIFNGTVAWKETIAWFKEHWLPHYYHDKDNNKKPQETTTSRRERDKVE